MRGPVILTGIAAALSLLGDQALYVILPTHWRALGLTDEYQVGLVLSVNRFVRLLTNHAAAWLIRRLHYSGLFVAVLVLGASVTCVYSLKFIYGPWPVFALLIAARLTWGFCWSMIRQIGTMMSIRAVQGQQVGRTIGLYNGLARAGSITGLLLGGLLFDEVGLKLCFFILAGLSVLSVIPASLAGRTLRRLSFTLHDNTDGPVPKQSRSLLICGFMLGCVGYGIIYAKLGDVFRMLTGDVVELNGAAIKLATFSSIILCTRHSIGLFFGPALGRLDDHIGHRRAIVIFFAGATAVLAATTVLSFSFWAVVSLMLLFFVFATCLMVSLMAEGGRTGSGTFAWLVTALDLGAAVGPLVVWTVDGWLKQRDMEQTTWLPFAIGAGAFAFATVIALRRLLRMNRAIPLTS